MLAEESPGAFDAGSVRKKIGDTTAVVKFGVVVTRARHVPNLVYFKSSIFPVGFGAGKGSVSGVTRTAVVNL
jgi:hypothetical protein